MASHMTKKGISSSFAYASLACSLSLWPGVGLYYLQPSLHLRIPGWGWVVALPGWKWELFEAFALLLAIVATALRSNLWPIALPVTFLMFLLSVYIMGS